MVESEADLLDEIALYADAINRHQHLSAVAQARSRAHPYQHSSQSYHQSHPSRHYRPNSSRNRTLVVNNNSSNKKNKSTAAANQQSDQSQSATSWISSRDRGHISLINAAVYDHKLHEIKHTFESKRKAKLEARDVKEKERLRTLMLTTLVHDGITYRFNKKGNLLIRVDDGAVKRPTPARTVIHGVTFLKSPKSDNLFRKTQVQLKSTARIGSSKPSKLRSHKSLKPRDTFCKFFTRMGTCTANRCPYKHSTEHLAICTSFLHSRCPHTANECNLSHTPSTHNAPTCTHFLRGACSKEDCKYSHVKTGDDAGVCREFAEDGWCERGQECRKRHVRECPAFSMYGRCEDRGCRLPHVQRASTKRRNESGNIEPNERAERQGIKANKEEKVDESSEEDAESAFDELDFDEDDTEAFTGADFIGL